MSLKCKQLFFLPNQCDMNPNRYTFLHLLADMWMIRYLDSHLGGHFESNYGRHIGSNDMLVVFMFLKICHLSFILPKQYVIIVLTGTLLAIYFKIYALFVPWQPSWRPFWKRFWAPFCLKWDLAYLYFSNNAVCWSFH